MADSVQRVLEEMVPELEEFHAMELFSKEEIKSIIAKRREAEYRMRKKAPEKLDYLKYIEYELNLDKLRAKRKKKMGILTRLLSDHACIRRASFAYERVTRKFKNDLDLWLEYIDFCVQNDSFKMLGNVFPRALQMHTMSDKLWMKAAECEWKVQKNMNVARILCQRGLRFVKTEAFFLFFYQLEFDYIRLLIQRKRQLGLGKSAEEIKKEEADNNADKEKTGDWADEMKLDGEDDELSLGPKEAVVLDMDEKDKAFLSGAVPRVIYKNAVNSKECNKSIAFRVKFLQLIPLDLQDIKSGINFMPLIQEILTNINNDFPEESESLTAQANWLLKLPSSFEVIMPEDISDDDTKSMFVCSEHSPAMKSNKKRKISKDTAIKSAVDSQCVCKNEKSALQLFEIACEDDDEDEIDMAVMDAYAEFLYSRLVQLGTSGCRMYMKWLLSRILRITDHKTDKMTRTLYYIRTKLMMQINNAAEAEKCVINGIETYPKDHQLWKLHLELVRKEYNKSNNKDMNKLSQLYRKSLIVLCDDIDVCTEIMHDFLQMYLNNTDNIDNNQIVTLFNDAIQLNPFIFKTLYLNWVAETSNNEDNIRQAISEVLDMKPRPLTLFDVCLKYETNNKRKCMIYEKALLDHGEYDINIWLKYLIFLKDIKKDIKQYNSICWRANHELAENLRSQFAFKLQRLE